MFRKSFQFKRCIATETVGAIIGAAGAVGAAGTSAYASGKMNKRAEKFNREEAEKQRTWNENMADKQNAWNYKLWQEALDYDAPASQLDRLKQAGLNPLYYGLDGNSAAAFQGAAQPLGYERASAPNYSNPAEAGIEAFAKVRGLAKDLELKNAQIDKLKEEKSGLELDNEFKDRTMDARAEGVELANSLTKEQVNEVRSQIKINEQEVKKKIEETKSEIERQGLLIAEKTLKNAQEKEIVELLPYKKLLMDAQTSAQKAAASASYMHALYEKGLIDSGYIDKLGQDLDASIRQHNSQADANDVLKAINEWKLSIKSGNAYDVSSIPWSRPTDKIGAYICNELFRFTSAASEALGGSLVPFAAAGLIGKGITAASASAPRSSGSYTTLYGPNGEPVSKNSW